MAAAYLFALHGILAVVALSHMAANAAHGQTAILCQGISGATVPGDDGLVRQSAPCAVCAAAHAAAAVPPGVDIPLPAPQAASSIAFALPLPPASQRQHTPKLSQGPPQSA